MSAYNFDKITMFIANVLDQDLFLFHASRISRKLRVFTTSTYEWISRHFYLFLTQRKNGLKFPKDQSMFDCFSKLFNLKQRTQRPFDFHFQNRLWLKKRIKIFQKIAQYNKLQFWSTRIETLILERQLRFDTMFFPLLNMCTLVNIFC